MHILQINNLIKSYDDNTVLKNISLSIEKGTIHGLIGENGAGKSTLMNILFGMPVISETGGYEGEIILDGNLHNPKTPEEALSMGIGMVHQEFMLIPGFSVAENIKLNRENTKEFFLSKLFGKKMNILDRKSMKKESEKVIEKLELDIKTDKKINRLPVGYMQFIEIAREIDKTNLKLLILDEPTAVLTEGEADVFLKIIKNLNKMGISILFITHRLQEIKEVTENITILRDGNIVGNYKTKDISVVEMAEKLVGRDIKISERKVAREFKDADCILELIDLKVDMPGEKVKGVDLKVRRGEILGIGGLAGQGKIGIANGILGLYPTTGTILKNKQELPLNKPRKVLDSKIAFVSEDRKHVGLLLDEPIDINIAYTALEINGEFIKKIGPLNFVDTQKIYDYSLTMIEKFDIRCQSPKQSLKRLSGGNQQKVCVARAITQKPDILLVSEPTRGVDIGAKNNILDTLVKLNEEEGVTIIITSSELSELQQVSDRIAIITEGKVQDILSPNSSDAAFGMAMSGKVLEKEVVI